MSFHENLKRLRKLNKISQEKLAEILGVSRQSIAKYECGKCYPDIDKLIIISDLFNISLDELLKSKNGNYCKKIENIKLEEVMDKNVVEFLCKAKKATYASGNAEECISSRPKSHDLEYKEGNMKYIDTYLGSSEFAGEEGLWKDNVPFWAMNYIGRVLDDEFEGDFLHEALRNVPEEKPFRGPEIFIKGQFKYECKIDGDAKWFVGKEIIYKNNKKVYECRFHGGCIY